MRQARAARDRKRDYVQLNGCFVLAEAVLLVGHVHQSGGLVKLGVGLGASRQAGVGVPGERERGGERERE